MPTSSSSMGDFARDMQDMQQRLSKAEQRMEAWEASFAHFRESSDQVHEDIRGEAVTKNELKYQLENIRLSMELISSKMQGVDNRVVGMETNIVKKVEDIAIKQQETQTQSLRRIITVQATILGVILASVAAVVVPLLLSHH